MSMIRRIKVGDPITADFLNAIAAKLERAANLTVQRPGYLILHESPSGKTLVASIPRPIWAQLSGSTSPYSFVEMQPDAAGTWTTLGGRAGDNAYSANDLDGLDDKIVKMEWTPKRDWRFIYPRAGVVCPPPSLPADFFTADALGTHTLHRTTPTSLVWSGGSTMSVDGYAAQSIFDNHCVFCKTYDMAVSYRLTLVCPVGATPGTWKLEVGFKSCSCIDTVSGLTVLHYGTNGAPPIMFGCATALGTLAVSVSDTIAFDPGNLTLLTFNIPTQYMGALATPGGGGTMTVTP